MRVGGVGVDVGRAWCMRLGWLACGRGPGPPGIGVAASADVLSEAPPRAIHGPLTPIPAVPAPGAFIFPLRCGRAGGEGGKSKGKAFLPISPHLYLPTSLCFSLSPLTSPFPSAPANCRDCGGMALSGPLATWMSPRSPQGRVYGVSRKGHAPTVRRRNQASRSTSQAPKPPLAQNQSVRGRRPQTPPYLRSPVILLKLSR